MATYRYVICDVFTERALTGNALAVFTDARGLDDVTMQDLAREMNLSETVFVLPAALGAHARLRIFTPRTEIPFAGHPTLGAAFVLGQPMQVETVRLETGAGVVPVRLERDGPRVAFGWMRQPLCTWRPFDQTAAVLEAVGLTESGLPVLEYDNGPKHVIVVAPSREAVAALAPDFDRLARTTSACVSVIAGSDRDWKSRMFAPAAGINEDPATGSAAGPIAVHLARHGRVAFGETIRIEQGTEIARPSQLFAVAHGSTDRLDAVEVGGAAVVIGRGEIRLA